MSFDGGAEIFIILITHTHYSNVSANSEHIYL